MCQLHDCTSSVPIPYSSEVRLSDRPHRTQWFLIPSWSYGVFCLCFLQQLDRHTPSSAILCLLIAASSRSCSQSGFELWNWQPVHHNWCLFWCSTVHWVLLYNALGFHSQRMAPLCTAYRAVLWHQVLKWTLPKQLWVGPWRLAHTYNTCSYSSPLNFPLAMTRISGHWKVLMPQALQYSFL